MDTTLEKNCVSVEGSDSDDKPVCQSSETICSKFESRNSDVPTTESDILNNKFVLSKTCEANLHNFSESEKPPLAKLHSLQDTLLVEGKNTMASCEVTDTSVIDSVATPDTNSISFVNKNLKTLPDAHNKEMFVNPSSNLSCLPKIKLSCVEKCISFSEIPERDVSLQDVNDYLDLGDGNIGNEENSGISFQEDVNRNNMSINSYDKEYGPMDIAASPKSGHRVCKIRSDSRKRTKICDNDYAICNVKKNKQDDKVIFQNSSSGDQICESSTIESQQTESFIGKNVYSDLEDMNTISSNIKGETGVSIDAVSEKDSTQNTCFDVGHVVSVVNTKDFQNISVNLCSQQNNAIDEMYALSQGKKETCSNTNINSSEILPTQYKQFEAVAESRLNHNNDNVKHFVEVQSLHLPVNADSISYEDSDPNFRESVDNINTQLDVFVDEIDPSISVENLTHSPKLQRPTTLNLPCLNATTPIMSPAVSSDMMHAAHDTCDESSEVLEEAHMEDKSASQTGNCEALLGTENVSHACQIGSVKPFWIPDSEAANCMHCNLKFTVIKRRHHCRACGKVLCSSCCNQKARLSYLPNKENRVCQQCFDLLSSDRVIGQHGESPASSSCGSSPSFSPAQVNSNFTLSQVNSNFPQKSYWRPHPNNPDDYCSTISPLRQVQHLANRPPPTVMVPVGVLKRGAKPRGEPKQVIFSDGIRPGGDLTDLTEPVELVPAYRRLGRRRVDKVIVDNENSSSVDSSMSLLTFQKKFTHSRNRHKRVVVSDFEGPLPPILFPHDQIPEEKLDMKLLIEKLKDDHLEPVVFAITKNLHVLTKITKLDCYFGKECWCFTSHGLCTVGQDEVLFILERFADEDVIPRDAFRLFSKLYDNASKGSTVNELGHIVFQDNIFGNWEHRGFLFIRPTFQVLNQLVLPSTPFLVAILIQKWEVPWAKVFPLRLMLRLGEECRHYPCSLVSIRFRKPVYYKIGETIMSVLADLRNYQFTIPFVPGLVVHIEEKKTSVNIPRNRYEKLMKVLNSNNVEHVLALGANFSMEADSHLVCMQTENGDYLTQAMNIKNTTRKVTGASFIVFSGALKSSTGLSAKFSIVEDGLLIQIPQETMDLLHSALREMCDLTINCGPINSPDPDEVVIIQWTKDDRHFNIGVSSPVDGRKLDGVPNLRIHTSTDYAGDNYVIRWTEVFFLDVDENANSKRIDAIDPCRLAETVAQACCMALVPFLDPLADAEMTRIGLRITLDTEQDKVEYEVGAQGHPLPSMYMNALDSSLIPVISRVTGVTQDEPIAVELIFHILIK